MPIKGHPSFKRPVISTKLWRYTDLTKFVDLLTSNRLWLTNAEILAGDDPFEGLPGPIQFPHRIWRNFDEVPNVLGRQILAIYGKEKQDTPEAAFKAWFMLQEQECYMNISGRRQFYVNCWHAANHESAAMWKIYGSPGAGVAIVTNSGRIESALSSTNEEMHLGAVNYVDPNIHKLGRSNAFDAIMVKRTSYEYEQEVRLVHWDTTDYHDPLGHFSWNEETLRFENLIEDPRQIKPGLSVDCDVSTLIERVVVSPFAPQWYLGTIQRLRDRFDLHFHIEPSKLLSPPVVVP